MSVVALEERQRVVRRVTWVGVAVNTVLAAIKFLAGWFGHSEVVMADAVHSLSDLMTDAAILVGSRYWDRPADAGHPHGHRRIETIVTLSIGLALAALGTGLLLRAVLHLTRGEGPHPGGIALGAALASIVVKELLYRWTAAEGRRVKSMPLLANAWHHRSDALSSIPAALAVGGELVNPAWGFLDAAGTAVVAVMILYAALGIARSAYAKLIDSGAPDETLRQIFAVVRGTSGVQAVHEVRTRYVGCSSLSVDLTVEVDGALTVREGHDIAERVRGVLLSSDMEVADVVVHVEPYHEACAVT